MTIQFLFSENLFLGYDEADLDWSKSREFQPEELLWAEMIVTAINDCLNPAPSAEKDKQEEARRNLSLDAFEYIFFRRFEHDFEYACTVLTQYPDILADRIRTFVVNELKKPAGQRKYIYLARGSAKKKS